MNDACARRALESELSSGKKEVAAFAARAEKDAAWAREMRAAVAKLCAAEEALEGECTCMNCLSIFDDPVVTLAGETFCRKCAPTDDELGEIVAANKQLATLCGKLQFMPGAHELARVVVFNNSIYNREIFI